MEVTAEYIMCTIQSTHRQTKYEYNCISGPPLIGRALTCGVTSVYHGDDARESTELSIQMSSVSLH